MIFIYHSHSGPFTVAYMSDSLEYLSDSHISPDYLSDSLVILQYIYLTLFMHALQDLLVLFILVLGEHFCIFGYKSPVISFKQ